MKTFFNCLLTAAFTLSSVASFASNISSTDARMKRHVQIQSIEFKDHVYYRFDDCQQVGQKEVCSQIGGKRYYSEEELTRQRKHLENKSDAVFALDAVLVLGASVATGVALTAAGVLLTVDATGFFYVGGLAGGAKVADMISESSLNPKNLTRLADLIEEDQLKVDHKVKDMNVYVKSLEKALKNIK